MFVWLIVGEYNISLWHQISRVELQLHRLVYFWFFDLWATFFIQYNFNFSVNQIVCKYRNKIDKKQVNRIIYMERHRSREKLLTLWKKNQVASHKTYIQEKFFLIVLINLFFCLVAKWFSQGLLLNALMTGLYCFFARWFSSGLVPTVRVHRNKRDVQ